MLADLMAEKCRQSFAFVTGKDLMRISSHSEDMSKNSGNEAEAIAIILLSYSLWSSELQYSSLGLMV